MRYCDWTDEDLNMPLAGFCYFVNKLIEVVPREKIHIIINSELRKELEVGILNLCTHYDVGYTLLCNIDKIGGHPTYKGMIQIKNQVLKSL